MIEGYKNISLSQIWKSRKTDCVPLQYLFAEAVQVDD